MGREKKARANKWWAKKNAEQQRKQEPASVDLEDLEDDDIDKFHKSRDKQPLEATDSEDEGFENPVFDLKAAQSSSSEHEDEGSEDDMEEDELDDLAAKIAKQAKIMRQKTGILDEDDDEDDEPEKERKDWGRNKNFYYSADNVDFEVQSSDEEGPAMEEAEARRLQKEGAARLRPEDFGQEEEVSEDEEELETIGKLVERGDGKAEPVSIETVRKDLNTLSKSERMQVVMSNAPELVGLLNELKEALHELDHKIDPLLKKVDSGVIATKEGKNYVQLKHMLLLSYCQSIVFYLLLKAEGRSVLDHPVVARLVEIRLLLEKIRPIDEKLQHQIEKIMTLDFIPVKNSGVQEIIRVHKVSDRLVDGTRMAKLTPATTEKPKEIVIGEESKKMLQELERLESKHEHLSERGKEKGAGKRSSQHLDYDEADVKNLEQQHKKIFQVIAEAGKRQKKPKIVSGDIDLPVKEDIGERRRKQQQVYDEHEPDPDDEAKQKNTEKPEKVKVTKEPVATSRPEPAENTVDGKRRITYDMEKNRGLTPYRNKASKNPRKKYKTKHGKAVIRRRGMVRDIRKQTGAYEGEPTGIRADLSRSVRFKA